MKHIIDHVIWAFSVTLWTMFWLFLSGDYANERSEVQVAIEERNRIHVIERGAEDDAEELGLSEHQEVNYVRCHLRPAGMVTCYIHTPPNDIRATCRARRTNELLIDGSRCRWDNPENMAHP